MPQAGKFGRKPPFPKHTHPRLTVEDYVDFELRASLPKPTANVSRLVSSWPMYLNDQLGDCTEAAKAHAIQALTANGDKKEISVSDSQVLNWYERDGGYIPGDPSTDNGCVIQTVLQNWHDDDKAVCPVTEFAEIVKYWEIANLKECLYLFGTVYLGILVPQSAMDQYNNGQPWTYVPNSPIVGGHAIVLQEVQAPGVNNMLDVVTWGQLQPMSREFFWNYCEEAWVVISPDWFNAQGKDPDGFDLAQLQADFSALT